MEKRNGCDLLYPFTEIVGQEEMKLALILNVINPALGGVLIRGEKGTAKSTAVRSLARLLPEQKLNEGCSFSCDPDDPEAFCDKCREAEQEGEERTAWQEMRVITLPVSATEDRVVGTLDIEHAIRSGEKRFEPGILAAANRNILYVDEVNLLEDHLVDLLLDAAAMGVNTVEREGISYSHPARFILVGTMNPEEGDLRPQLIDRFGLVVDISGERETTKRMEVIERRLAYEADPAAFISEAAADEAELGKSIEKAKTLLPQVVCPSRIIKLAAEISCELEVEGHRADIVMIKCALTHAAYRGSMEVDGTDLFLASRMALPHRMRRVPFQEGLADFEQIRLRIESEMGKTV